ncbi:hypothetical protein BGZ89_002608 [Linnemannia elongata]|nr:hypothetical protein BGZ89_002608 [Linnemannia elongata]
MDGWSKAVSVDKDAIAGRMDEIRKLCSDFEPDDIYNCDETGMYLREFSTLLYTMEELASGAKPERGAANRVSILFCVNAAGSSFARAATGMALRPLVIGKCSNTCPEVPITSINHGDGYMALDLSKRGFTLWLTALPTIVFYLTTHVEHTATLAATIHLQERHGDNFRSGVCHSIQHPLPNLWTEAYSVDSNDHTSRC